MIKLFEGDVCVGNLNFSGAQCCNKSYVLIKFKKLWGEFYL